MSTADSARSAWPPVPNNRDRARRELPTGNGRGPTWPRPVQALRELLSLPPQASMARLIAGANRQGLMVGFAGAWHEGWRTGVAWRGASPYPDPNPFTATLTTLDNREVARGVSRESFHAALRAAVEALRRTTDKG